MITRKRACALAASHLKLAVRELGRPVRDSCEQPSSPEERGSGGQWGAVGVAGGGRAPFLAWLGIGRHVAGLEGAPQAKR